MSTDNSDRLKQMFAIIQGQIWPWLKCEMQAQYGHSWLKQVAYVVPTFNEAYEPLITEEVIDLLSELAEYIWEGTQLSLLLDAVSHTKVAYERWLKGEDWSDRDTYSALGAGTALLEFTSAQGVERVRQLRREVGRVSGLPSFAGSSGALMGIPSWREVVFPRADIVHNKAEPLAFKADLDATVRRSSSCESAKRWEAEKFFSETYLTRGLHTLLAMSMIRVARTEGPWLFALVGPAGCGKTHALQSLYHAFSGVDHRVLDGVSEIVGHLELDSVPKARLVLLTRPAQSSAEHAAIKVATNARTQWGELALQLGGESAYGYIEKYDKENIAPGGEAIRALIGKYGPAIILVDDWIDHARGEPLECVSAKLSFLAALLDAVACNPRSIVAITAPTTGEDLEGLSLLDSLNSLIGRRAERWAQSNLDEIGLILCRRLFESQASSEMLARRNIVVGGFTDLYRANSSRFPKPVSDEEYRQSMTRSYPIHPQFLDLLNGICSTVGCGDSVSTRLRILASIVRNCWLQGSGDALLQPGSVPLASICDPLKIGGATRPDWDELLERELDRLLDQGIEKGKDLDKLDVRSVLRRMGRTIVLIMLAARGTEPAALSATDVLLGCVESGATSDRLDSYEALIAGDVGHSLRSAMERLVSSVNQKPNCSVRG